MKKKRKKTNRRSHPRIYPSGKTACVKRHDMRYWSRGERKKTIRGGIVKQRVYGKIHPLTNNIIQAYDVVIKYAGKEEIIPPYKDRQFRHNLYTWSEKILSKYNQLPPRVKKRIGKEAKQNLENIKFRGDSIPTQELFSIFGHTIHQFHNLPSSHAETFKEVYGVSPLTFRSRGFQPIKER